MSERVLHLDGETRATVELRETNAFVYFEHPDTDVWCVAGAFDGEEPELWQPGDAMPEAWRAHIEAGGICAAFNAAFEILLFRHILGPRYGWATPDLRAWRCTMVKAMAMALPGKLEQVAPALGLDIVKDSTGSRLMLQMSKPRRPRKGEAPGIYWWNEPEKIERLGLYCVQDVRTEMAVDQRVLPLSPAEQELWFLDQEINSRGVYIDQTLCHAAKRLVGCAESRLDKELAKLTDFAVTGVSNTGQLTAWLRAKGLDIPGVAKDVIEGLLVRDDLDPVVRRAVEIRQEGGKTSVAKIDAMLARRQKDGRMRGNLQFHGAATGRWAGRGAQLQNLARPSEEFKKVDKEAMIATIIESKDDRLVEAVYGNTLTVVSDCVRGMITAAPGHQLFAADFESIESIVNAWLAGEERKIKLFEEYFAGRGPKIYNLVGADIFNCRPDEIDPSSVRYLAAKVAELSLGFQGGPGALAKMGKNYKFDLMVASAPVRASATPESVEKAEKAWKDRGIKSGMSEIRWKTAELIKSAWRSRNPKIVAMWHALEDAAIEAVQNPGKQVGTGKIDYKRVGSFLFCRLPSGRVLTYPYPTLKRFPAPWTDDNGKPVMRDGLVYKGVNSVTRQWSEQHFYGGLACENVVQAVARDCMVNGMMNVAKAGYPIVLTVHDEAVAERPLGEGSREEFEALMVAPAPWMRGLPLAAEGYVSTRYRK